MNRINFILFLLKFSSKFTIIVVVFLKQYNKTDY